MFVSVHPQTQQTNAPFLPYRPSHRETNVTSRCLFCYHSSSRQTKDETTTKRFGEIPQCPQPRSSLVVCTCTKTTKVLVFSVFVAASFLRRASENATLSSKLRRVARYRPLGVKSHPAKFTPEGFRERHAKSGRREPFPNRSPLGCKITSELRRCLAKLRSASNQAEFTEEVIARASRKKR